MDPVLGKAVTEHRRKKQLSQLLESRVGHTPVSYLVSLMEDPNTEIKYKLDAAKALLPYLHAKKPVESVVTTHQEITSITRKII